MRLIVMVLVLTVAAVAGFLVYRNSAHAPQSKMFEPPVAAAPRKAEDCTVERAIYEYNDDRRLTLRFRPMTSSASENGIEVGATASGRPISNMLWVITVTSLGKEYAFAPDNGFMDSGPAYLTEVRTVHPQGAPGQHLRVMMFDSDMHVIPYLPRGDSRAPGYLLMPDLMRRLYADHVNLPMSAFRFQTCEEAPAATP